MAADRGGGPWQTFAMRPFKGVRALDLTHVLAGPFCTYQLAMLGADVVKIEPPHSPDMTRAEGVVPEQNAELYETYFQSQSGGKRAMTLDLRHARGQAVLRRLLCDADVLVQNYAGGAAKRLGIAYDDVSGDHPRLIYCSLSGFGQTGPKADHPAYDIIIQAFSGLMAQERPDCLYVQQLPRFRAERAERRTSNPWRSG
jgi:crotonobetainyl-CoA:carnitine CoA-transferase CaiB-like acyl-CoA transferase